MEEIYGISMEKMKTLSTWSALDKDFTMKVYGEFGTPAAYYYKASC